MSNIIKSTLRRFGTTVYVLEVPKGDFVIMPCLGDVKKRQPVQDIRHNWFEKNNHKRVGGVNGGFFDSSRVVPFGLLFVDSGFVMNDSWINDDFLELIHENNKLVIDDITAASLKTKYPKANWALSLSYSLVINGKKDIRKGHKFTWTNTSEPRTLVGDNAEKYIFVVTEGRIANEKGLTADESAELMLELGATTAINCDGGGSSAMDIEGKIVNKYYANRAVTDAILIYAKPGVNYKIVEPQLQQQNNILIVGDPGHGGSDRANRGPTGYIEADGVLDVALEWRKLMEADGYNIKLTRDKDMTVALYDRSEMANRWGGQFYISLHTNAAADPAAGGIDTFYTLNNEWGNKQHSEEAKRVAAIVQKHLVAATGLRDRGIKTRTVTDKNSSLYGKDYYAVIRRSKMPTLIVEMGFHTNHKEEALLKTKEFRMKLAKAVHAAFKEAYPMGAVPNRKENELEVTAAALNVRNDKMGIILGQVYKEDQIDKLGEHPDGDWYIIRKDRLLGFVSSDFVK